MTSFETELNGYIGDAKDKFLIFYARPTEFLKNYFEHNPITRLSNNYYKIKIYTKLDNLKLFNEIGHNHINIKVNVKSYWSRNSKKIIRFNLILISNI